MPRQRSRCEDRGKGCRKLHRSLDCGRQWPTRRCIALIHAAYSSHLDVSDVLPAIAVPRQRLAAGSSHPDVVRCLASVHGAKTEAVNAQGGTAPIYAATNGHLEAVRCLASDRGAKIEATAAEGRTALMLAAASGDLHVVRHLASHRGAKVEAKQCTSCRCPMSCQRSRGGGFDLVTPPQFLNATVLHCWESPVYPLGGSVRGSPSGAFGGGKLGEVIISGLHGQ
jgi:hypothetical protein